jgi:hypothetical protein
VFQAFGIEAQQRVATIKHQATEEKRKQTKEAQGAKVASGALATAQLEQKKRKLGAKTSGPPKRKRVMDILFGASSPLKAKGDSEDARDEKARPLVTPPLASAPPPLSEPRVSDSGSGQLPRLEVINQEAESDEDDGEQINIVGSPIGGAKTHDLVVAEANPRPHKAPSSSRGSSSSSSSCDSGKKTFSAEDNVQRGSCMSQ